IFGKPGRDADSTRLPPSRPATATEVDVGLGTLFSTLSKGQTRAKINFDRAWAHRCAVSRVAFAHGPSPRGSAVSDFARTWPGLGSARGGPTAGPTPGQLCEPRD